MNEIACDRTANSDMDKPGTTTGSDILPSPSLLKPDTVTVMPLESGHAEETLNTCLQVPLMHD